MKIGNSKIKKEHIGIALLLAGIAYYFSQNREISTTTGTVQKTTPRTVQRASQKTSSRRSTTTSASSSVHRLFARGGTVGATKYALSNSKVVSDIGGVITTKKGGYTYEIHTAKTSSGREVTGVTVHTPYKLGGLPYTYHVGTRWVAGL